MRRWHEKRGTGTTAKKRSGVAINRWDLVSIPVPGAELLWKNLHLRQVEIDDDSQRRPRNIRVTIERERLVSLMRECVTDQVPPKAMRDRSDSWWSDVKASDDFLDRVFHDFFDRQGLPDLMRKSDYHELARFVPRELVDAEVVEKLDLIVEVSEKAVARKLT